MKKTLIKWIVLTNRKYDKLHEPLRMLLFLLGVTALLYLTNCVSPVFVLGFIVGYLYRSIYFYYNESI